VGLIIFFDIDEEEVDDNELFGRDALINDEDVYSFFLL
jgi:hypothetical protein